MNYWCLIPISSNISPRRYPKGIEIGYSFSTIGYSPSERGHPLIVGD